MAAVAAIGVLATVGQANPFKAVLDGLDKPRHTALADMDGKGTAEMLVIVDDPADGPAGTPLRPWMVLVESGGQAWTAGAGHAHAPGFRASGDGRDARSVDGAWLHLHPEQMVLLPFGDVLSSPEARTGTGRVADRRHFAGRDLGETHPEMMHRTSFPLPGTAHRGTVLQLVGDA